MDPREHFECLADSALVDERVTRSTMMGYPCLRHDGQFYASFDPKNQQLVIKLPTTRVAELIENGVGQRFAPNGRVFREWVSLPFATAANWAALVDEAKLFIANAR